jgi:predicted cupin superfamily sugar epimerase
MVMDEASRIIADLGMIPHPEGGHYRETFRDIAANGQRSHSTAIYYLLRQGESSHWHRVDAAEVWHHYSGGPLELRFSAGEGAPVVRHILGKEIASGERPQIIVPAGHWQAAKPLGAFTLCGCTVAPGFEFAGFELAQPGWEP